MDNVVDFIKRRFPKDCDWKTGNCYYFALILKDRFPQGEVYYDVINGHFVFGLNGRYYDWDGKTKASNVVIKWSRFDSYDEAQMARIIRDCLM